jgi:hypothetical protein
MRVCLLTDKPDHPLIAPLPRLLGAPHRVTVLDPHDGEAPCPSADPSAADCPPADLYLLKAHSPQAVAFARWAQGQGAQVVNTAAATEFCQDRVRMADRALAAGLPFPVTRTFPRLSELATASASPCLPGTLPTPDFPLIVKSRVSRRRDLVIRLEGRAGLRALEAQWGGEPIVVQEALANDGWDYKLYVIGTQVLAGRRSSPLDGEVPVVTHPLDPSRLPPDWLELVRVVGESFGLQIYGVDILATARGPVIVDINAFPGCRVPGASEALAAFVLGMRGRADRERGRRSRARAEAGKAEEGDAVELRRPTTTRPGGPLSRRPGGESDRHATLRALSARLLGPVPISRPGSRPGMPSSVPASPDALPASGKAVAAALHRVVGEVLAAAAVSVDNAGDNAGDSGGHNVGHSAGHSAEGDWALPRLRVASVRRKSGRGLIVSYRPGHYRPGRAGSAGNSEQALVTARVADSVLDDPGAGKLIAAAEPADFQGRWPGILRCHRTGLTLQCFPYDAELPSLAAAFTTSLPTGNLAAALTAGAEAVLGVPGAELAEVLVSPVRYKAGDRCVLRYQVRLTTQEVLVFFGKLYRDPARAAEAYRLAERLWAMRDKASSLHRPASIPPAVPRPLALVEELGLVLTETAGGAHGGGQLPGTLLLRPPRRLRTPVAPPEGALAAAAAALAWMHTSGVTTDRRAPCGSAVSGRVHKWSRGLRETVPGLSGELDRTVGPLIDALQALTPTGTAEAVLVHGAFKPSQLVFCAPHEASCQASHQFPHHAVITDLDGAGPGDPALDAGCFLAYLRPPGVMRGHPGANGWYEKAKQAFLDAYLAGLAAHGVDPAHLSGLRQRAALFDAALLLKIASRRARRMNSPRIDEVRSVMGEIGRCLEQFAEEGKS